MRFYLFELMLCVFVALKLGTTVLATWSWWWLLLPLVPDLALLFQKMGVV